MPQPCLCFLSALLVIKGALATEVVLSEDLEQRILQAVGERMEQLGEQYMQRLEQLQTASTRTLTQVEDKLGQLQERARVWDTFQSVITTWTDLLVGTDRKMDLLKEGIERTVELYDSISPYSAVSYQVDQLNVKLSRLLAKIPETSGAMVNDFAIKGVMATLRELKTKIEGMNRRRFVVKKVVNSDAVAYLPRSGSTSESSGADVQYRDIQDELEEALSSNNMLNSIEIKLERIESAMLEGGWRKNASGGQTATVFTGGRVFSEPRHRAQGETRGRRGGGSRGNQAETTTTAPNRSSGSSASCDRLLKQWSQMELSLDQLEAMQEAVGRMEDMLDYRTSTVDVKLDRLEDLMFRQSTKLEKSDVAARQSEDALLARLATLQDRTLEADVATLAAVLNVSETARESVSQLRTPLQGVRASVGNLSDAIAEMRSNVSDDILSATSSSAATLGRIATALENGTAAQQITLTQLANMVDLVTSQPRCDPTPLSTPAPATAASTARAAPPRNSLGLRGCEDLADLGMTADMRYRFGEAAGPPLGLDYLERYCDMHTDGGGWTIIQRRSDFGEPKLNFSQPWEAYKHGFGDLDKEFWFGNENIHRLTNDRDVSLRVDLADFEGNTAYAVYTKFKVSGEEAGYHLEVAGYRGNASDSLTSHNLSQFSTWDVTNDKAPPCCPCANAYGGGWWFNSCFESNLNGEYHTAPQQNDHYHGIIWELWKGDYSLKSTEMKVRARSFVLDPARLPPPLSVAPPTTAQAAATESSISGQVDGAAETAATTDLPATTEDLGIEPLNV